MTMPIPAFAVVLSCALFTPAAFAQTAAPHSAPRPGSPPVGAVADAARTQTGMIAWYGPRFAGRKTASGQRFDPQAMTMAHPTLPFGTRVRVTNLSSNKSVIVHVNDRGPTTPGRIADLSQGAARQIDMIKAGVVEARLEVLSGMTSR